MSIASSEFSRKEIVVKYASSLYYKNLDLSILFVNFYYLKILKHKKGLNLSFSNPEKERFAACCNIGSFIAKALARIHRVTATPYCSLNLPPAALANVPPLPVPALKFKSSSPKNKKDRQKPVFF